jgi:hypothetical protein
MQERKNGKKEEKISSARLRPWDWDRSCPPPRAWLENGLMLHYREEFCQSDYKALSSHTLLHFLPIPLLLAKQKPASNPLWCQNKNPKVWLYPPTCIQRSLKGSLSHLGMWLSSFRMETSSYNLPFLHKHASYHRIRRRMANCLPCEFHTLPHVSRVLFFLFSSIPCGCQASCCCCFTPAVAATSTTTNRRLITPQPFAALREFRRRRHKSSSSWRMQGAKVKGNSHAVAAAKQNQRRTTSGWIPSSTFLYSCFGCFFSLSLPFRDGNKKWPQPPHTRTRSRSFLSGWSRGRKLGLECSCVSETELW